MSDDFYRAFEERYRGSRQKIIERLKAYQPFLAPFTAQKDEPVAVDFGCGRGEWLEYVGYLGFSANGVDLDEGMLASCEELGLEAKQADMFPHIRGLHDGSASVLSAFHVVEHIAFEDLREFVEEAVRVLTPGGLLIMETPNPENISVATCSFYMDPTHNKPIPAELLAFVAEYSGFHRVKILRLQEAEPLREKEAVTLQDWVSGASPDYAVVAQKEAASEVLADFDEAFGKDYGISLNDLTLKWDQRFDRLVESINQLQDVAREAEKSAKAAEARAEAAENKATATESRASQAEERAEAAADSAEKAKVSANEALTRSDFAETRAEFAETRAELAQTSAAEAKGSADKTEALARTSVTQSEQALAKATNVETKTAEIENQVSELESRAADIEEKANLAEKSRDQTTEEVEGRVAAVEAQAHEAHSRACYAEATAHQEKEAIEALLNSRSWRWTGALRVMGDLARNLAPRRPQPRHRTKIILEHAALYIGRRPRLKRFTLGVLNRLPQLRARLVPIAAAAHFPLADFSNNSGPQEKSDEDSENLAHLTPQAQRIYQDLKATIEQNNKGGH